MGDESLCRMPWPCFQQPPYWPAAHVEATLQIANVVSLLAPYTFPGSSAESSPDPVYTHAEGGQHLASSLGKKNLSEAQQFPGFLPLTPCLAANPCHHKQDGGGHHLCAASPLEVTVAQLWSLLRQILWPRRGPHRERAGGVWKGGSHWPGPRGP